MSCNNRHMKRCILFPSIIIPLVAPLLVAAPQTSHSMQPASASISQRSKWTEADRKALLARARHGDAGAQFWLGTGFEQGWFGKVNFKEALKWLRKAAAHGNPDAQVTLGQMYENGEGVPQNYEQAANGIERQLSTPRIWAGQVREGTIWGCSIWVVLVFRRITFRPTCGSD